mmetsp:Transcript_111949/g.316413  ORF Transcript_111949/g.316413 Transcript_111949/m.316413 type:complete len:120 (+) Transcript_111949:692-1051(+)
MACGYTRAREQLRESASAFRCRVRAGGTGGADALYNFDPQQQHNYYTLDGEHRCKRGERCERCSIHRAGDRPSRFVGRRSEHFARQPICHTRGWRAMGNPDPHRRQQAATEAPPRIHGN